jgi:hypothetical protein
MTSGIQTSIAVSRNHQDMEVGFSTYGTLDAQGGRA